jgi:hypothetical protein
MRFKPIYTSLLLRAYLAVQPHTRKKLVYQD